ncbi:glycosyltransferase family 2 protein [uncultured Prevotella sp.]|uniref:glycosyltransferase n=1 Tax=uncultured Prevotella sp. TaxID=159272 RepID=UPI0026003F21|nr:glycosyltransferase family 2 protein [uncultured Prevotella sp.]
MDFWWILYIIDGLLFLPIAITVLYILAFSIIALFKHNREIKKAKELNRYIVLIPSYKSGKRVLETVNAVLGQTYNQRNFDIVVIADHESEMINMRLAQMPITLLTPNFDVSSKAKSLQYAILNLPQFKIYDAVIILDAGNIVDPDFLELVNDAYDTSGSKAIQTHRVARNRDTSIARMDATFEEINNTIFRSAHLVVGLSAALNSSGSIFNFVWFKQNIMKIRSMVGEDKELEGMLVHDGIFIDYFEDIHVYDEKTRNIKDFNNQRGRWTYIQLHSLLNNIHFLPSGFMNSQYDQIDKIIQWMLIPRTIMMGVMAIMSMTLPFIYLTLAIKWWIAAAIVLFAFSLATPNYLVDKHWDRDYLNAPLITVGAIFNIFRAGRDEAGNRLDTFSHLIHKLEFKKKKK